MAALATVADYVSAVRVLLQDSTAPFRYPDTTLVLALNMTMLEVRTARPDLFMTLTSTPSFTVVDTTTVPVDEMYRMAVVYFTCGYVQLQDEEFTQDARAAAFLQKGLAKLTGLA